MGAPRSDCVTSEAMHGGRRRTIQGADGGQDRQVLRYWVQSAPKFKTDRSPGI